MTSQPIRAIFFDIGNTLGTVNVAAKILTPFPDMAAMLKTASKVFGVPVGVITDVPDDWTKADVERLLKGAGLLEFLDPRGIVTSVDAGQTKKDGTRIFELAASRFGVQAAECLFFDDSDKNVANACKAGMSAIQKVA